MKLRWQGRWGLALVVVVTAVALIWQSSRPAAAQGGAWSQPRLVFETDGTINYPTVVTDAFGQVHAFWVVLPNEVDPGPNQLYYTRLDRPDWKPVDIFVSNESFTELAGIANTQRIALFWHGDTYTWAGVSPSASAQDWQPPTALHDALPGAGLALAPDGAVWMAYAVPSIQAMYVRRLDPASAQWEDPHWVANVTRVQRVPNAVRVAVGADNSLHVVWAEYQAPDGWPPLGLYYTNSTDQGLTWLPPQQAADTGFNQPNVATGPNAQVYLTWVGMVGVGGKYFQESGDAGRTWGRVEQISLSETLGGSRRRAAYPGGRGRRLARCVCAEQVRLVYVTSGRKLDLAPLHFGQCPWRDLEYRVAEHGPGIGQPVARAVLVQQEAALVYQPHPDHRGPGAVADPHTHC
ncbi:MAG: exo-alpha-sialidase [Anaerolineae bacterium]|nr:exo-alpha-sialidase [Anaerolineae bacterium]